MAIARIHALSADGDGMTIEVEVESSYPDAVAEACSEALRMWARAVEESE